MSGYFTFKYLEGPKIGQRFQAKIDPFYLNLDDDNVLMDNPLAA
jgi:hypothetical protein